MHYAVELELAAVDEAAAETATTAAAPAEEEANEAPPEAHSDF